VSQKPVSFSRLRPFTATGIKVSATFKELSLRIAQVGEVYARVHGIPRSADWYLLKLTEELGELTAEHLLLGGRSKANADGSGGTREALENEAADLFGQFVLYLRENDIDIEAAIERKWLRHLGHYMELDGANLTETDR
jgi:NTP pyrophosphatase (non-canonical NTP hydrolase)